MHLLCDRDAFLETKHCLVWLIDNQLLMHVGCSPQMMSVRRLMPKANAIQTLRYNPHMLVRELPLSQSHAVFAEPVR